MLLSEQRYIDRNGNEITVLILILLDVTLREYYFKTKQLFLHNVLILILLDVTLRELSIYTPIF